MYPASIIALPGTPESFAIAVNNDQIIYIGRKAKPNILENEQCIALTYPEVSAKHAEIRCKADTWTIVDTGSTNGTTVNGVSINPGKEYSLQDEDVIGIANYLLVVSIPKSKVTDEATDSKLILEEKQEQTHLQVKLIRATILVADLKNFTSLMEEFSQDPAQVMQAAANVFSLINKEIEGEQGQLEKIAGDAVMAYWPSKSGPLEPAVSAHKACLAASKIKELIKRIASDKNIWPFTNHALTFDIALATGTVAKGALGKSLGNPALLGDTANLAFRMEKLIASDQEGKIILDQNTYDLVKENFLFKYLGEFEVKGRQSMVNLYELEKAIS